MKGWLEVVEVPLSAPDFLGLISQICPEQFCGFPGGTRGRQVYIISAMQDIRFGKKVVSSK